MMDERDDPYCYPGTSILKNLAGYQDRARLDVFESRVVAFNLSRLEQTPITLPFGAERLKETHRRIFAGVYSWAGEFRQNTGLMTKQRGDHAVSYADSAYIERELGKAFAALAGESHLQGLGMAAFAIRAAYYYAEIDAIHPFREGNSRTLRQFFTDLALQAGHRLDWSRVSGNEDDRQRLHVARDIAVMAADSTQLTEIIGAALQQESAPSSHATNSMRTGNPARHLDERSLITSAKRRHGTTAPRLEEADPAREDESPLSRLAARLQPIAHEQSQIHQSDLARERFISLHNALSRIEHDGRRILDHAGVAAVRKTCPEGLDKADTRQREIVTAIVKSHPDLAAALDALSSHRADLQARRNAARSHADQIPPLELADFDGITARHVEGLESILGQLPDPRTGAPLWTAFQADLKHPGSRPDPSPSGIEDRPAQPPAPAPRRRP